MPFPEVIRNHWAELQQPGQRHEPFFCWNFPGQAGSFCPGVPARSGSQGAIIGVTGKDKNVLGFASKVIGHLRFGFAAGCEARAPPRRPCLVEKNGLSPWFGLGPP